MLFKTKWFYNSTHKYAKAEEKLTKSIPILNKLSEKDERFSKKRRKSEFINTRFFGLIQIILGFLMIFKILPVL